MPGTTNDCTFSIELQISVCFCCPLNSKINVDSRTANRTMQTSAEAKHSRNKTHAHSTTTATTQTADSRTSPTIANCRKARHRKIDNLSMAPTRISTSHAKTSSMFSRTATIDRSRNRPAARDDPHRNAAKCAIQRGETTIDESGHVESAIDPGRAD